MKTTNALSKTRLLAGLILILFTVQPSWAVTPALRLAWSDDFNYEGLPDPSKWNYEQGISIRNNEAQAYLANTPANACVSHGMLTITGLKQDYTLGGKTAHYTSASLTTRRKAAWQYGQFVVRAKLPSGAVLNPATGGGIWPAIWFLGITGAWPADGEIDLMEYYQGSLKANFFWGSANPKHPAKHIYSKPVTIFGNPNWASEFHIWRMDWDSQKISLYVDDLLLNSVDLTKTVNEGDWVGAPTNPFHQPEILLINLALGGNCGRKIDDSIFPQQLLIDYVHISTPVMVWTRGGSDNNWSTESNWASNSTPTMGNFVTFAGTSGLTPVLDSNVRLSGVTFDSTAGNFVLSTSNKSTLTIAGVDVTNSSVNTQTINVPIVMTSNVTFNAAPGNIIVGEAISGDNESLIKSRPGTRKRPEWVQPPIIDNASLIKCGPGTLTLLGVNTYTGDTVINAGVLSLGTPSLSGSSNVLITHGAQLKLNFTGPNTIAGLLIDGVKQSAGTWGGIGSGAEHPTALIAGSGWLKVGK